MRVRSDFELFQTQRRHAATRGIEFMFTFDEWVAWWVAELGQDWRALRGPKRGQFVMGRHGDKGPYASSNVKCITCQDNQKDQQANGLLGGGWNKGKRGLPKRGNKLTEDQVLSIYRATGTQRDIATSFGVHQGCVSLIKLRKTWAHLTAGLADAS